MAHREEPMDVDCMDSDFDNSYHHSNVLPFTEKGYEELDVSELNMKLRYSITPAASPMSKSYTACVDNRSLDSDDLNGIENANLTRSLNTTMTKNDSAIKPLKALPLQTISAEQIVDNRGSVLRQLDSTTAGDNNNVTVTITESNDFNENISLPSSSSSATHTPEATTPTNIIKNEEGSPIMRGLKTVFNMFRSSQSPIHLENDKQQEKVLDPDETYCEDHQPPTIASTPISVHRSGDGSSKRSSPLKDSIIFNDDLEKELQWRDETVLFSDEKIPIHKLFLPLNKPVVTTTPQIDQNLTVDNLNSTVEYMDISNNHSIMLDNTLTETHNNTNTVESDGEFVDCETTFTKNESLNVDRKEKSLEIYLTQEIGSEIVLNINKSEIIQEDAQQTLDITREIVLENDSTLNKTEESNDRQNIPSSDSDKRFDVTSEVMHNDTEVCVNEFKQVPLSDEGILIMTKENININVPDITENSVIEVENYKEPFDASTEIKNEIVPSMIEYEGATTVVETVIAEDDVSTLSKSIDMSTGILLDQEADNVENYIILPDVEDKKSFQEENQPKESIDIENVDVLNKINPDERIIEVDIQMPEPEIDINITQIIEKENNCKEIKEAQNIDPAIVFAPDEVSDESTLNMINDIHVLEHNALALVTKTEYKENNVCPSENTVDTTINVFLATVPERNIQLPSDLDAKDVQFSPCNLLCEESANMPLPDGDDFDDLESTKDKTEIIQTIPPDVLDSVITELKVDATNISENAIAKLEILHTYESEKQDILNETSDIVNSLTEIIGESGNNTIIQSECMLDLSENKHIDVTECTDEIHILPDLLNQTILNSSINIDNESASALNKQSQPEQNIETIGVSEMHGFPNLPEIELNVTEQNKITDLDNEFLNEINLSKQINTLISIEHPDTIPFENIDTATNTNQNDSKNNVCENVLKEKTVPDEYSIVPNTEVNEIPIVDEELVLSENNSPYVSVISDKESKPTEKPFENIDIALTTTNEAPSSPPIRSKGYNFNFDEMDNPFATQTKIRQSPPSPSIEPENEHKNKTGALKKVASNRRRSQPPEKKRPALNKKKFNTTFDATGDVIDTTNITLNDQNFDGDSKNVSVVSLKNSTITTDNKNKVDKEVSSILDSTQILEKMIEERSENDLSNVQTEKFTLVTNATNEMNADNKLSIESISTTASEIKTNSSSEQSTYYSAVATSSDSSILRNVFNIPEIEDKNFNPFATKSKMRQSPPLELEHENPFASISKMESSSDSSILKNENTLLSTHNSIRKDTKDKTGTEVLEKDSSYNVSNITSSSKDDKNITMQEFNTEDEDTEEGPFLEGEDAVDKFLDINDDDMKEFHEIPAQSAEENVDGGELFIDAAAFEFLLNKDQTNVVTDSGKESLFLKFDPLFAKRISSDGVLAALNKVQKKQSTPTKTTRPSLKNEASPIAGPSALNVTYDEETNVTQDSIEDLNVTVAKPMMVVTPAVNPAVTPRNKTTTPTRSNRRSITFTSPAMAVIDRLISLSANNSLLGHDATITQTSRDHIEADIALSQLRELLAEKEISVYQLRSESKELKDRLSTMETQMKFLEADGQDKLNKINELDNRFAEKTKVNKSMEAVVEEYERMIACLIAETEQDKKRHAEERIKLINERDEQTAHLASMESSFSDLHRKYEKSKQIILSCKANEDTCKKSIKDFETSLTKIQTNYEMLKQHATSKLNHANQELQKMNKSYESEVLKLNTMIKRKEMHVASLEDTLAQKIKANKELTEICDELINKVGGT